MSKKKAKQLNLTDDQKDQLKERAATDQATAESALLKLYAEVWLPRVGSGGLGLEPIAAGGRPLQTTLNDKKQAMIHERTLELITSVQKRVFSSLKPGKLVELFKLGDPEGAPGAPSGSPTVGISTAEVVDGMYGFLGFTRLLDAAALRKTIADGVQDGHFGYFSGPKPTVGPDGRYQVALNKVRTPPAIIAVDGDRPGVGLPDAPTGNSAAGPSARPGAWPRADTSGARAGPIPPGPQPGPGPIPPGPGPGPGPTPPPKPALQTAVNLSFTANRDALFTASGAIANLADMAGQVNVTLRAESAAGFDRAKLENGVMEPLREADLIE